MMSGLVAGNAVAIASWRRQRAQKELRALMCVYTVLALLCAVWCALEMACTVYAV